MSDKEHLKQRLCEAVDVVGDELKSFAMDIHKHPEHGFFETRTSDKFAAALGKLGLDVKRGLALTGVSADIKGKEDGPCVAVMGELDGITCAGYQYADPQTGASHTCGHDMQLAMVLGVASALVKTGAMNELAGRVRLFGVPAEEFIRFDERQELKKEGKIEYLGGKQELIRIGALDDVDMTMLVHAGNDAGFDMAKSCNGFRAFMVTYSGRQAHAAAAPDKGINALYAAVAGINAVNALRETFRDEDCVRVHFIITKGGDSVNCVPDDVRLEGYVRANNMDCIAAVFEKVRRAFIAGGDALGAKTCVTSLPGYLPLRCDPEFNDIFAANATALVGAGKVMDSGHSAGSTDMGDISHIMPTIQPHAGGAKGALHSAEYQIVDIDNLIIEPAKVMCMTLVDLLADDAARARKIISAFKAPLSRADYIKTLNSWFA